MSEKAPEKLSYKRRKYRMLYKLEEELEIPMFLLSLFWLYLLIVDLVKGLSQTQNVLMYVIWSLFIIEYLIKLFLAPRKLSYIKNNWIILIALVIPAFRVLRVFYALRILRSASFISSANVVRALTSGKRFLGALKEAQGPQPEPEMNVGVLIVYAKEHKLESLKTFAETLVSDVKNELQSATEIDWNFDKTDPSKLENDNTKRPSDFLTDATLRMAEGPYDLMIVITDVAVASRKNRLEPGFTSTVARIVILSTRELIITGRKKPVHDLQDKPVRLNGAALLLHLLGSVFGLSRKKRGAGVMAPYVFREERTVIPAFNPQEKKEIRKIKEQLPERELRGGNAIETFLFHVFMAFRHPLQVLRPLIRNKAIFLPLSLPKLATAAVGPCIILLFTAEIWDAGLGMQNNVATGFAIISVMGASFYLVTIQSLFLPRKEKRIVTEHMAVANTTIYLSIFIACIGLFLMVGALMLFMENYVFPSDLINTWPTLNKPQVTMGDKIRLAAFISTIGVTTGALAGGFESRAVFHHLALFEDNK